jgi:hypothetical protein
MHPLLTKSLFLTALLAFLPLQALDPAWSITPKNQVLYSTPFSDKEVLKVEKEITISYDKKGQTVIKVHLQKDSDYSLSGYIFAAEFKSKADNSQPTTLSEYACSATKSLDGSIAWSCSTKPPINSIELPH